MKTLRLLLWADCNRSCEGCCNKQWDLNKLPVCDDYSLYDTIILTGGEPLLYPEDLIGVIGFISRVNPTAKIIVYTAMVDSPHFFLIAGLVDGITLTLHDKEDAKEFARLDELMDIYEDAYKSLRLNVFKEVGEVEASDLWEVKRNIEWIENFPLPPNEVFMRFA